MNKMEKFCLKRNEFETNIRESFRNLRKEERLFDVTLATFCYTWDVYFETIRDGERREKD